MWPPVPPQAEPEAPQDPGLSTEDRVVFWRLECLLHVGCPPQVADVIAASRADLHQAVKILQEGCDPELAQFLLT